MRRRPSTLTAAVLTTLVAASALMLGAPSVADSGTGLPSDPAADGYIGLCDESGHNVTGGDVDAHPFIWKAVASSHPPAQFMGAGQNAVLNVYQPRPSTLPAYWSGMSITAAAFYTGQLPAVQATYGDTSLAEAIAAYPPKINGLYVLRMYYGKQNYGLYSRTYPVTVIQVVGTRWTVVSGGTVDCGAAKAVSNEQLTGVASKADVTPRSQSVRRLGSSGGASASAPASGAPVVTATNSSAGPITNAPVQLGADGKPVSQDDGSWWLWPTVGALVLLAVLLVVVLRARAARPRSAGAPPDASSTD